MYLLKLFIGCLGFWQMLPETSSRRHQLYPNQLDPMGCLPCTLTVTVPACCVTRCLCMNQCCRLAVKLGLAERLHVVQACDRVFDVVSAATLPRCCIVKHPNYRFASPLRATIAHEQIPPCYCSLGAVACTSACTCA